MNELKKIIKRVIELQDLYYESPIAGYKSTEIDFIKDHWNEVGRGIKVDPKTGIVNISYNLFTEGEEYNIPYCPWISVDDKLPEPMMWVFTCSDDEGNVQCIGISVWNGEEWYNSENEAINVDYWMEIPKLKNK